MEWLNAVVRVAGMGQYVQYLIRPNRDVGLLEIERDSLVSRKESLQNNISLENRTNEMVVWMGNVEKESRKVDDLLNRHSYNPLLRLDVSNCLKRIQVLKDDSSRWNSVTAINVLPQEHTPAWDIVGLESQLEEIRGYLEETEFPVIGIVGPAGIGKTTLLTKVAEKEKTCCNSCSGYKAAVVHFIVCNGLNLLCDFRCRRRTVLLVKSSTVLDFSRTQSQIASQLGLTDFDTETEQSARAERLRGALSRETFLILLDDVMDSNILAQLGIPIPQTGSRNKILFTTRSRSICSNLSKQNPVALKYLHTQESWSLFHAATRFNSSLNDYEIRGIAEEIVEWCGGLPVALVKAGRALAQSNNIEEWRNIKNALTEIDDSLPMDDAMILQLHATLRTSFDRLNDEVAKACFLFCVLFRDFRDIDRNQLAEYWAGEKLLLPGDAARGRNNRISLGKLKARAQSKLRLLLSSFLLEDGSSEKYVKVHNAICSMAAWLATQGANENFKFKFCIQREFSSSLLENLREVKRASLVDIEIDIEHQKTLSPCCRYLVTLLMGLRDKQSEKQAQNFPRRDQKRKLFSLGSRKQRTYSSFLNDFFKEMSAIEVLDVSGHPIQSLPNSICQLKCLRYLNLSYTFVEMIQVEFSGLTNLKQFDLSYTQHLNNIPTKAFSSLSNLNSFNAYYSKFDRYSERGQLQLTDLVKLPIEELGLSLRNWETLQRLANMEKLIDSTRYLHLASIDLKPDDKNLFELLKNFGNLETLAVTDCEFKNHEVRICCDYPWKLHTLKLQSLEIKKITVTSQNGRAKGPRELHISSCEELNDLYGICRLRELQVLQLNGCDEIARLRCSADCEANGACLTNLRVDINQPNRMV